MQLSLLQGKVGTRGSVPLFSRRLDSQVACLSRKVAAPPALSDVEVSGSESISKQATVWSARFFCSFHGYFCAFFYFSSVTVFITRKLSETNFRAKEFATVCSTRTAAGFERDLGCLPSLKVVCEGGQRGDGQGERKVSTWSESVEREGNVFRGTRPTRC